MYINHIFPHSLTNVTLRMSLHLTLSSFINYEVNFVYETAHLRRGNAVHYMEYNVIFLDKFHIQQTLSSLYLFNTHSSSDLPPLVSL